VTALICAQFSGCGIPTFSMGDKMRIEAGKFRWRDNLLLPIAGVGVLAAALAWGAPRAWDSGWRLYLEDDPSALASHELNGVMTKERADAEVSAALASGDIHLANSFADLARDRGVAIDGALIDKLAAANTTSATAARNTKKFVQGLIVGEPDDVPSFAGTAISDLLVYGDLRDAYRETSKLASGEQADELVLGLACVGIAVTAGTYASLGAVAPARASITLVKAARKANNISAPLQATVTRALRETVDTSAIKRAVMNVSLREPGIAVRAVRDAVKLDKAGSLTRMIGDLGAVRSAAGTRAAVDGLKLAETPRDLTRMAKLAQKEGTKTRAILKLLGRSALAAAVLSFNAATSLFGLIVGALGFCGALKSAAERLTWRYLQRRKRKRIETTAIATASP
jgi:hypothetical protein